MAKELDWGVLLLAASRMKKGTLVHIYRHPHIAGDRERSLCCREEYVFRKAAGENSTMCPDCLVSSHERTHGIFIKESIKRAILRTAGWFQGRDRHGYKYYDKI